MKTPLLILIVCLSAVSAFAQPGRTLKLTQLEESPDTSLVRDGYAGVTDTNGRQRYTNFPRINLTCLTYTPPSTGNLPFYHSTFVTKCSTDSTWYIDWTGRAFFLGFNGSGGGGIYGGSGTVGETSTVVSLYSPEFDRRELIFNVFKEGLPRRVATFGSLGDDGDRFGLFAFDESGVETMAFYSDEDTYPDGGIAIRDIRTNPKGLVYEVDYGATFVDRSLVDKEYVDNAVAGGGGGVTSVGLVAPTGVFDVSGSPVTGTGNLTLAFDNQSANTFFAGPTSGGAATPAFRAIVAADVPLNFIDSTHIKSKGVAFTNLGPTTGITSGQGPVWDATASKFVARTLLTSATNATNNLSGLLTSPTVVAIQDVPVAATTPTNGQVLAYNSGASEYQPTTLSASGSAGGDLTGTYPNPTIGTDKVDSTKVANGKLSLDDLNQRGAASGQAIAWNGSAWRPTSVPKTQDVQVFTSSGTWTKPANAKSVRVIVIGSGGGGGSGSRYPNGSLRTGAGGGGSGGRSEAQFDPSALGATVTITVGTGGPGGLSRTTDNNNGFAGTVGAASSFGSHLSANGGGAGTAGTNAGAATGGAAGTGLFSVGSAGGASNATGATGSAGGATNYASTGGGAGGGITTGNAASNGASGGTTVTFRSAFASNSGATGNVDNAAYIGQGGGGSNANTAANPLAGGNGGGFGAGGGGGGATSNGFNSGAGGAGSNGAVIVITSF